MRILFLFCILFFTGLGCTPQTGDIVVAPVTNSITTMPFPESWVGEWTGELEIWKGSGVAQRIPMKMSIKPTDKADEYHWLTTFGDQAETTKPYLLKATDAENGLYVIDEQNSIVIESYLFDNKLVSWYVVMESLILATFEKRGAEIVFEILAGSEKPISTTGGEKVEEEDIPEVKTLPFNVMQRAVLRRE